MFSFSEFFLIIFIALLVLDPSSLQDLLNRIVRLQAQWLALQKEQILAENNKRAQSVDESYKEK